MTWCFQDEATPQTDKLLDRLRNDGAVVPELWRWEVANVLVMAERRKRLTNSDVVARLGLLDNLPITLDSDGADRAWRDTRMLAEAHALTVYDAAYLELALRLGCDLATLDKDLRAAAKSVGIRVRP